MTPTELITPTINRHPKVRANASRSQSAKRTAESNRRHRDDSERAATRQNQHTVVMAWKQSIEARMFKDATGTYTPFVLNDLVEERAATDSDAAARRRRMITNVCESSTLAMNPLFSKAHPTRHKAADSVGMIVLPATTAAGTQHLHGFLRLPRAHPHARQVVAACLMSTFQTRNLWMNDVSELKQDGASLDYLAKTWKQEHRDWDSLEFVPSYLFVRLSEERR